jgi:hypothetical protein
MFVYQATIRIRTSLPMPRMIGASPGFRSDNSAASAWFPPRGPGVADALLLSPDSASPGPAERTSAFHAKQQSDQRCP